MTFTLNEIETIGQKAARGSGRDWGIAEEAGKATRWLAAHELPGPELLAGLLARSEGECHDELAPVSVEGVWQAGSGWLCPLIAGAALADRASEFASGRIFQLETTAYPLLLGPYAYFCAVGSKTTIELSWPHVTLTVSPGASLRIEGDEDAVLCVSATSVRCRAVENIVADQVTAPVRRPVDAAIWEQLNRFALRTYAPATEESRELGAGADLIDSE